MADFDNWPGRPAFQSRQSQSSIKSVTRKPLSPTAMAAPHHRHASDNISLDSRFQTDETIGLSRVPSSVSAESRSWLPMGAVGPSSPPADGMEGVDLGSPEPGASFSVRAKAATTSPSQTQRPPAFHHFPSVSTSSSRPKPTPFEFADSNYHDSPSGPYQSTFSPRAHFQQNRTDSEAHLLNTPSASDWTTTPRTPAFNAPILPPRKKWWNWRPAWLMYVFLLFGFCCALGHHLFYAALHGRPADNQLAMLRYGTILAFAAKAGLVASVVTAYRQRIWTTVRNKLLSVAALDSLFAATDDLSALWNAEIYQKAKLAMGLALVVWFTPLVIILTANTLLVAQVENIDQTRCPGVRTLNFTGEELEDFRSPTKIDGLFGQSLNYWNNTTPNTSSPNFWDYYTGPTDKFQAIANLGIYSHTAMGAKNAAFEICGSGWNCTYTINFIAPGYKCEELANGVDSDVKDFGDNKAPFGTDILLPRGNYSYFAHTSGGDYAGEQMKDAGLGGVPTVEPPFPKHLGAFRVEPIVWVGYVVRVHPDETPPNNRTQAGWNESFVPKVFACEHYETAYTVDFHYQGQDQTTNVTKREFLHRIIDTTYVPGKDANDGTNDNTTAVPERNYVLPYTDVHRYRRVASYHSIGVMLRQAINGTVYSENIQSVYANTKGLTTKLLNPKQEFFAYPELQDLVESLYEDIILSMFSRPELLILVWAAKPYEMTGDRRGDDSTLYPCTRTRWENRYHYVARDLWIVYSCAVLCAIIAVVLGTAAVLGNEGQLYNTRFSSIVAATRGPGMEKVVWRDRGDLPSDVGNLKVGYGLVHRASALGVTEDTRYPEQVLWDGGEMRYGFGLEGHVRQLKSEGSLFRGRSTRS